MVTLMWLMAVSGAENSADGADRHIQAVRDLAIGALESARLHQRAVEFVGQPRAIRAQRLDPGRQFVLVAVGLAPPLDRAFQPVERRHQAARRRVEIGGNRLGQTWIVIVGGRSLMRLCADLLGRGGAKTSAGPAVHLNP